MDDMDIEEIGEAVERLDNDVTVLHSRLETYRVAFRLLVEQMARHLDGFSIERLRAGLFAHEAELLADRVLRVTQGGQIAELNALSEILDLVVAELPGDG